MRRSVVPLAAAVLAVLTAAPASAAPPEEFSDTGTYPAGTLCQFPLQIEFSGKSKVLERDGYVIITGPRNVLVLTNAATGASATVRLGGIFKDADLGGGRTATVATGRNFVGTRNAGLVLLVGRFEFTLDAGFNLIGDYEGRGQIIDLCAEVS